MYWYITGQYRYVGRTKPTTKPPMPTNIWSILFTAEEGCKKRDVAEALLKFEDKDIEEQQQ
jgi:hypothetical protein